MKLLSDYQGFFPIRLSDERLAHILYHPEMADLETEIEEILKNPVLVIQSVSDAAVRLYYRFYPRTKQGDKFVCVVVKVKPGDAFVLTAYLTDKPKRGTVLWNAST
jgi:hypothetical protein